MKVPRAAQAPPRPRSLRCYPFAESVYRESDLEEVVSLGWNAFGSSAFNTQKFKSLLNANGKLLLAVRGPGRRIEGYVDIIPLRPEFAQGLISGARKESDIQPSDIISEGDVKNVTSGYIYLAAFVTRGALGASGASARHKRKIDLTFPKLVWAAMERAMEIATTNPAFTNVIALAYSEPGLRYLQRLGFDEIGHSSDGLRAFLMDITRKSNEAQGAFAAISDLRLRFRRRRRRRVALYSLAAIVWLAGAVLLRKYGHADYKRVIACLLATGLLEEVARYGRGRFLK
jgi:hypothetical protein